MNKLFTGVLIMLIPLISLSQKKQKPNILVIWGDDIGTWNISHNNRGMMGYKTPNIDRVAKEGIAFTDYYAQQSCTAGRAAFIGGSVPVRSGMTKVGMPGAKEGWQESDLTMATVLKSQGYTTGQFGKNHQGDRDEHLPTNHGFDEFFGNLYHLNAEEEPENFDYPAELVLKDGKTFKERFGPRGVIHSWSVGQLLDLLDELGITDNTVVMYSTDNGVHYNTWPDAGTTIFHGEKNSSWEGAYRVPAFVRWPGHFPAGETLNGIVAHEDWLPTFAAIAGEPDIVAKAKKG